MLAAQCSGLDQPAFHFCYPVHGDGEFSEYLILTVFEAMKVGASGKEQEILIGYFTIVVLLVAVVRGMDDFNPVKTEGDQLLENFIRYTLAGWARNDSPEASLMSLMTSAGWVSMLLTYAGLCAPR